MAPSAMRDPVFVSSPSGVMTCWIGPTAAAAAEGLIGIELGLQRLGPLLGQELHSHDLDSLVGRSRPGSIGAGPSVVGTRRSPGR